MIPLMCGILKNKINEQAEQKRTHRYIEQTDGSQMGGAQGRGGKGDEMKKYMLRFQNGHGM